MPTCSGAADSPAARNEDFNIVNGDVFRWKWLWPRLAAYFGIEAADLPEAMAPLAERMQDAPAQWRAIAQQHDLAEADISRLASWWHTDADLGRPMEVMTDMGKSRKAGFLDYQVDTQDAFFPSVREVEGGAHHSALTVARPTMRWFAP